MPNITLTIDGKQVQAKAGQSVLEAALDSGIYIPHLCHLPELRPSAVCRLCIVEMTDGQLVTSCRVPATEGMVVSTRSPAVDRAVRPVVEMLIGNHHQTCRGCPASGNCELQTVMGHLKIDRKRVRRLHAPPAKRPLEQMTPQFDYDPNHCVLCGICVRTSEETHGTSFFQYVGRGHETKIAFFGDPATCDSCIRCVELCPVGAFVLKKPTPSSP